MHPWAPIFVIERSDKPEVFVEGIISAVEVQADGSLKPVLTIGNDKFPLWSRSVLKPWQLLSNLSTLKQFYPWLQPEHLAIMTASHSADVNQLCLLREIMQIAGLKEEALKCPPAMPKPFALRSKFEFEGIEPGSLFHNCSGKHLSYLLYMKAHQLDVDQYLKPDGIQFKALLSLLSQLTGREFHASECTVDGCGLPNYALTAQEISSMYCQLMNSNSTLRKRSKDAKLIEDLNMISNLMLAYPDIIGGGGAVDSEIMKRSFLKKDSQVKIIAKVGAEGLLALGIGSCEKYPYGAGILIKLAHGFFERHMEMILSELFRQMQLSDAKTETVSSSHIKPQYFFNVA